MAFRTDCLYNEEVVCSFEVLKEYLLSKEVASQWWDLTDTERYNLAYFIALHSSPDGLNEIGMGSSNCAGGITSSIPDIGYVCSYNALIRVAILGSYITGSDSRYYRTTYSDDWVCLGYNYDLPVYKATVYGHGLCAFQIKPDINDPTSWYFFQYGEYDIKPSSYGQITLIDPINIIEIDKLNYFIDDTYSTSETNINRFVLEKDGTMRLPKSVTVTVSTDAPLIKLSMGSQTPNYSGDLTSDNPVSLTLDETLLFPIYLFILGEQDNAISDSLIVSAQGLASFIDNYTTEFYGSTKDYYLNGYTVTFSVSVNEEEPEFMDKATYFNRVSALDINYDSISREDLTDDWYYRTDTVLEYNDTETVTVIYLLLSTYPTRVNEVRFFIDGGAVEEISNEVAEMSLAKLPTREATGAPHGKETYMAPLDGEEFTVGSTVTARLQAYNDGSVNGNIRVRVSGGSGECDNNAWLDPFTGTVECSYSFAMPDSNVQLLFEIYHWITETEQWTRDWATYATVNPTTPGCTQYFRIYNENAELTDPDNITVGGVECTKASTGSYYIELTSGQYYEVITTKGGYYDSHDYFTACGTKDINLQLLPGPEPETCTQRVLVVDRATNYYIQDATVKIFGSGGVVLATGNTTVYGEVSFEIENNIVGTIQVEKDGYETYVYGDGNLPLCANTYYSEDYGYWCWLVKLDSTEPLPCACSIYQIINLPSELPEGEYFPLIKVQVTNTTTTDRNYQVKVHDVTDNVEIGYSRSYYVGPGITYEFQVPSSAFLSTEWKMPGHPVDCEVRVYCS